MLGGLKATSQNAGIIKGGLLLKFFDPAFIPINSCDFCKRASPQREAFI
jgi:hypothetical protein